MTSDNETTEVSKQYATAYTVHYETQNFRKALACYKNIITTYPNTKEATYAHSQIQNIVNSIVPSQVLFDMQMDLALSHLT